MRRFRPPPWAWLGLLPALALLTGLGTWQWSRGDHKIALQARLDASTAQPAQRVPGVLPVPDERTAPHLRLRGDYLPDRQLLLDNQGLDGHPGYHVWTPLRRADGQLVIVDRGWVAEPGDRALLPDVGVAAGEREVDGLWRPLPVPGLRLAADNCASGAWPRVVQYPTADDLRCLYREAGAAAPPPGVLLLDATAADGYARDWRVNAGVPPQRHYAYALQWYAFAATLLFLFVKLNLKSDRRPVR